MSPVTDGIPAEVIEVAVTVCGSASYLKTATKGNTVQLVGCDLVDGWVLGSGPGGVVGAFDVPFGHLSFDDAGLGAQAAGWVEPGEQAVEE